MKTKIWTRTGMALAVVALAPLAAVAQGGTTPPPAAPTTPAASTAPSSTATAGAAATATPSGTNAPVSLDLRDAPIRDALQQLFTRAKVDYVIDPAVQGYVTLKLTDQPFDAALRLMLRAAAAPLTYHLENGVYIVQPRRIDAAASYRAAPPAPAPSDSRIVASDGSNWDTIQLTYADPADLAQVLRITILRTFTRQQGQGGTAGAPAGAFAGGSAGGFSAGAISGAQSGFAGAGVGSTAAPRVSY